MKTITCCIPLVVVALTLLTQATPSAFAAGSEPPTFGPVSYTVAERGPHHRLWQRIEAETNDFLGQVIFRTNTAYVELETGMHFLNGDWVESKAQIELLGEGAAATNLQFQVFFAADIQNGTTLVTPEGKQLRSRILGLSYFDGSNAVLIAEPANSIGLLSSDRVHYTNAFDDVDATVEYVVTKAGLSQNIILKSQLPSPAEWGLNPQSSRLQVLTEFFDPPVPAKAVEVRANGWVDEFLDFGEMKMTRAGQAFAIGEEGESDRIVPVVKQWTEMEGRTFLVEEVPFKEVDEEIQALERRRQSASLRQDRRGAGQSMMAALKDVLPTRSAPAFNAQRSTGSTRMAKVERPLTPSLSPSDPSSVAVLRRVDGQRASARTGEENLAALNSRKGFVLDYTITLTSATNFIFKGDHTHQVSGTVNLGGTTIFEAVLL